LTDHHDGKALEGGALVHEARGATFILARLALPDILEAAGVCNLLPIVNSSALRALTLVAWCGLRGATPMSPLISKCARGLAAIALLAIGIPPLAAGATPTYTATALPNTIGGTKSWGYGINASGQVTGKADIAGDGATHAFLYSGGTMTDLGTLGGSSSSGSAINDNGQVTGGSYLAGDVATHAFLYSGGSMTDLGTLGGRNSGGYGINAGGEVTGRADMVGNQSSHAFIYSNGIMTDLGTLGAYEFASSTGTAINASGQVTGWTCMCGHAPSYRAFLYSGGTMTDLGTLGGANSWGWGINARGQVTGTSATVSTPGYAGHIFLYANGALTDLGTLGGEYAESTAINANGQVTGWSYLTENVTTRAFLYSGGTMYDLNTLVVSGLAGAILTSATAINDKGQIVANGCSTLGCTAFRLDPVAGPTAVTQIPMLSREALGAMVLLLFASGLLLRRWRNL
jgi:probable HAF family extracellular repeat protein